MRVRIRMFDHCYRCGDPGHTRRNCPQARKPPDAARAAPAAPASWKPPPPPRDPHIYPSDHWLLHDCPFCERGAYQQCWNAGTGKERRPHDSRLFV